MKNKSLSYQKYGLMLGAGLFLVLLVCVAWIFFFSTPPADSTITALIYQDGELLYEIPLSQVTESYELTITDSLDHYNRILVQHNSIGMIDANCPDKLCVHMGFQGASLLPITCLPHNLVIRLEASTPHMDLDGTTY